MTSGVCVIQVTRCNGKTLIRSVVLIAYLQRPFSAAHKGNTLPQSRRVIVLIFSCAIERRAELLHLPV